jgi:DeoR/GlpR family transcriptional regulator of sugar metabolism
MASQIALDPPRSKEARLEYITNAVQEAGYVGVDHLAELLEVSRMTIHRDLDELQRMGSLRKVRGGASLLRTIQLESDLRGRLGSMVAEKKAIAQAAVRLIRDGDVVMLDDSTSALELVGLMEGFDQLTVITNFMSVMDKLRDLPQINLISLGGQYSHRYASFSGIICEDSIARLSADVVFVSTSSMDGPTLYHQDHMEVGAKRAMIACAARRVLLMDHSKIGQRALYKLGSVSDFTHVVVDSGTSPEAIRTLQEEDIEVIVAG